MLFVSQKTRTFVVHTVITRDREEMNVKKATKYLELWAVGHIFLRLDGDIKERGSSVLRKRLLFDLF